MNLDWPFPDPRQYRVEPTKVPDTMVIDQFNEQLLNTLQARYPLVTCVDAMLWLHRNGYPAGTYFYDGVPVLPERW